MSKNRYTALKAKNERLQFILAAVEGPAILHVGCVGGAIPRTANDHLHCLHSQLCKALPNAELLGIDINTAAVQEMRERGMNVRVADAEDMHLGLLFDTIVAGELIEHLSNPGRFLACCRRHLKPEGRVILSTPNPFSFMPFLMYLKNFTRAFNPEHTLWLCPQTLTQLAQRYGFQVTNLTFVDDLRPELVSSAWYRIFVLLNKSLRIVLPKRFRNTIVAVLKSS